MERELLRILNSIKDKITDQAKVVDESYFTINEMIKKIEGFPVVLANELKHCILAHHGELEFGSPKKPALIEALALSFADNIDAKMETFTELLESTTERGWLGYNRFFESNVRMSE